MGLVLALFTSVVALFTFSVIREPDLQGFWQKPPARDIIEWDRQSEAYRPDRKAVMSDSDGNARRTADGTQLTRRDRGREFWSLEQGLGERVTTTLSNISVRKRHPLAVKRPVPSPLLEPVDYKQTPESEIIQTLTNTAPASAEIKLEPQQAPVSVQGPMVTAPLHQTVIEFAPLSQAGDATREIEQVSMGRLVKIALAADGSIPEAEKASIHVSQTRTNIVLSGAVSSEDAKSRIDDLAQTVAGNDYDVENKIVVIKK